MTPRYREIADNLRARVVDGEFAVGTRLPPIAELMEHYGVPSLNTIRQAQRVLVDESLLESQQGRGVFVISAVPRPAAGSLLAELRTARASIDRAIASLERGEQP